MAAGVTCCYASDNIRDAWHPYGNADLVVLDVPSAGLALINQAKRCTLSKAARS